MPTVWSSERKRDYYYRRAKSEQFYSRAAYKLLEVVEQHKLIQPGDIVVDLGAAPGGWMQAALRVVGIEGFILGVDLRNVKAIEAANVLSIAADITESKTLDLIRELLPREADVVISDVSPNISGVWELDHARQIDLARRSLQIAISVLKNGGNFFVKVFQGDMLNEFVSEVRRYFKFIKLVKPRASRRKSSELFVLGVSKL